MISPELTLRSPFECVRSTERDYRITPSPYRQHAGFDGCWKGEIRERSDYIEKCQAVAGRTVAL